MKEEENEENVMMMKMKKSESLEMEKGEKKNIEGSVGQKEAME